MKGIERLTREIRESEERRIKSVPRPIRDAGIPALRYLKTKQSPLTVFPKFCDHVLETYPGYTYVFIDRDARPIYITMETLKTERNLDIENRIITFTTNMIPKNLLKRIKRSMGFEQEQRAIEDYAEKNSSGSGGYFHT